MKQRFCNGMIHVIKPGENLYQLSRKYRVPLALILRANPYVDVYNLQPGQEVCIPMSRPIMPFPGLRPSAPNRGMDNETIQEEAEQPSESESKMKTDKKAEDRMNPEDTSLQMPLQMEQQEEKEEFYMTEGKTSLAEVLQDMGVSADELLENNPLEDIILAENVKLSVPKKV